MEYLVNLTPYEEERRRRIELNEAKLASLGLRKPTNPPTPKAKKRERPKKTDQELQLKKQKLVQGTRKSPRIKAAKDTEGGYLVLL